MNPLDELNQYEMRHLCAHLAETGRLADLHSLLALETDSGTNAWFEAQRRRGGLADYAADLEIAWGASTERANTELAARGSAPALGLEFRCALLVATLGSLALGVPPALLARAVESGVLTAQEAYTYAEHNTEAWARADGFARLAPLLPEGLLRAALAAASALPDQMHRNKALTGLLPCRAALGEAREAFRAALDITDAGRCAEAVSGIAGHATPENLAEFRSQIEGLQEDDRKQRLLAALAPAAPAPIAPELEDSEVERALLGMKPGSSHREQLPALAGRISPERARQLVADLRRSSARLYAVEAALVARLPEPDRQPEMERLLAAIRPDPYPYTRTLNLAQVAPLIPEPARAGVLREALDSAAAAPSPSTQRELISTLAPLLSADLVHEALAISFPIRDQVSCTTLMSSLWPHISDPLCGELRTRALAFLRNASGGADAVEKLARIAAHLPHEDRLTAGREALAGARHIEDAQWRAKTVKRIVPLLAADLLPEAVAVIDSLADPAHRADAICGLIPLTAGNHREELLSKAWQEAEMCGNRSQRAEAFAGLAAVTAGETQQRAIEESWRAVSLPRDDSLRISHMAKMATRYPAEFRAGPLDETLNAIDELGGEGEKSVPLMILAPVIVELLGLNEALRRIQQIEPGPHRATAIASTLVAAARLASGETQRTALSSAIDSLHWLDDEAHAASLASLLPWMDREQLARALDSALGIGGEPARAETIASLLLRAMIVSPGDAVDLWRVALRRASRRQRDRAFSDTAALALILGWKGGREALEESARATLEVMRWFP